MAELGGRRRVGDSGSKESSDSSLSGSEDEGRSLVKRGSGSKPREKTKRAVGNFKATKGARKRVF